MTLGEKIAARKALLGITSDDLASQSQVPLGTLNKILNGETQNPTARTLAKIASALGCTVEFLYGRNEQEGEPTADLTDGLKAPGTAFSTGVTVEKQELIDLYDQLPDAEKLVALRMLRGLVNTGEK